MEKLRKKTQEIIKQAFEFWDMKDWNPSDIDPVINLLFTAIANESINLEKQIKDISLKARDSLVHAILPQSYIAAKPACVIASATPLEPTLLINKKLEFHHTLFLNTGIDKEMMKLSFHPTFESKLFNIKPRFRFDGSNLINLVDQIKYQPVREDRECQSIWYGLDIDNCIESFEGLSIYFTFQESIDIGHQLINDFSFVENVNLFYESKRLETTNSLICQADQVLKTQSYEELPNSYLSYIDIIKESLHYFEDGFINITNNAGNNSIVVKKNYPDSFLNYFNDDTLKKLNEELVWLEFRIDNISREDFKKINVHFNAFPLINLCDAKVLLNVDTPIQQIPVDINKHLVSVTKYAVFDDYHNIIPHKLESRIPFTIRNIDMEKFTGQDLHDLIDTLLERYKIDYHAFQEDFNLSSDDIYRLREALKPIQLEKIKKQNAKNKNKIFAILNTKDQDQITSIEIDFNLTNGERANQIKRGDKLETKSSFFAPDSITLLTRAYGGRDQLSNYQKIATVRNLILSNNKIVTAEDIRAFCSSELGDMVKQIMISESTMKGDYGLKKCILLKIELDKMIAQNKNLQIIRQNLERKIRKKSSMIIPVMVNLKLT